MSQVNRSAVRVRPRQPYIDWANAHLDGGDPVSGEDFEDASVYLLPIFESDDQAAEILQEYYDLIFALELASWSDDESVWPEDRTLATFFDWFEFEASSLVVDLDGSELQTEED